MAVIIHWVLCAQTDRRDLMVLRGLVGLATTASIVISDKYHNGDLQAKPSLEYEIGWLRCDFVGISAILSTTGALWSAHFGWRQPLPLLVAAEFVATACLAACAFLLFETDATPTCYHDPSGRTKPKPLPGPRTTLGRMCILGLMGLQFFVGFTYMVYLALPTACAPNTIIYFTYLPGILLYAFQWPRDGPRWGAHDLFHNFVVAGHVVSAACDYVNVSLDCAAVP